MIETLQLLFIVSTYLMVAGISAWFGMRAGAEMMQQYWGRRK